MSNYVIVCLAALFVAIASSAPNPKGICIYKGTAHEAGQRFTLPGVCQIYTCEGEGQISALTCPAQRPADGCYFKYSEAKDYPQCCEVEHICPPDANKVIEETL